MLDIADEKHNDTYTNVVLKESGDQEAVTEDETLRRRLLENPLLKRGRRSVSARSSSIPGPRAGKYRMVRGCGSRATRRLLGRRVVVLRPSLLRGGAALDRGGCPPFPARPAPPAHKSTERSSPLQGRIEEDPTLSRKGSLVRIEERFLLTVPPRRSSGSTGPPSPKAPAGEPPAKTVRGIWPAAYEELRGAVLCGRFGRHRLGLSVLLRKASRRGMRALAASPQPRSGPRHAQTATRAHGGCASSRWRLRMYRVWSMSVEARH